MHISDALTAFLFDECITWFGITIENALHESVKVQMGAHTEHRPKYTLALLLSENYRLPRPDPEPGTKGYNPWDTLKGWIGKGNSKVKRYVYVPPVENDSQKELLN